MNHFKYDFCLVVFMVGKKFVFNELGIAFTTSLRKTRNSLFCIIPKEVCVGCGLKKGQKMINYLVQYEDKIGLFIPLKEKEAKII